MAWMADGDPVKLDGFNKMPLIEYFILLDIRIENIHRTNKTRKNAH